ncbi:MAG: phosphomannomutase/phosphoglucomutase [Candidatus Pacebacteria bacterium]|nr:phosphomannomutase/phosphoglucomutase [Candidatus Paceibacterota bacterium]
MPVNPLIFKSYDIRGIYPLELDEDSAYIIGRSFIAYTKAKKVAVSRDGRISSSTLFKSLVKGITDSGADVFDIGEAPTECLYFSVSSYNLCAGIMITASHNPKEYNGFKMVENKGNAINVIRGRDLSEAAVNNRYNHSVKKGKVKKLDFWQRYLRHILSFAELKKIKNFKIVIDASNGMASKVLSKINKRLPFKIIPLNFKIDGNFKAHPPNPLASGSTNQLSREIKEKKADFGFIFDGDADRVFLLDEKGKFVQADITLLLLAKHFLKKYPRQAVGYNVLCSKAVPEFIKKWSGRPIRTQVGFVNVSRALIESKGILGGELSGHYSFRDNFYLDSGFIAFLSLVQLISESGKKVSEIVKEFSIYAKSQEISFKVKDKELVLMKIKEKYSDGVQDYLDGVTVEYDNWWFNIRGSQTEPVMRLTVEAETKKLLYEKQKELIAFVNQL